MNSGDGLGGSLRDCRPAFQKGQKYQMVKNLNCEGANSLNQANGIYGLLFKHLAGGFFCIRCKFEKFHDFCSECAVY